MLLHNFRRLDARAPYDFGDAIYDQTRARLMACHAAILRFRWEHDRLPKSLEELGLRDLAIDPYSGEPLLYEPRRDTEGHPYHLASIGPVVGDAGERREITVEGRE